MELAAARVEYKPDIYPVIEEILYCWFRFHMPAKLRTQIFEILLGISQATQRMEFPIDNEDYVIIFEPKIDGSTALTIRRYHPSRLKSDKRLAFMKAIIEKAKRKPGNNHLRKFTTSLRGKSLIFTFPLLN